VFPVYKEEIGGIFAVFFLKICTTMAGVGGGPIIQPVVIVLFGFLTKDAVTVGAFATFLATVASFIANFRQRHPEKRHSVLLDYGVTSIMMPTTLAGAQIGSYLLVILPAVLV